MRLLLNILWFILGGWISGTAWILAGVVFAITIVGLPWVPAAFRMAGFSYWPFGKTIDKCVKYITRCVQESGFISAPGFGQDNMYGHGFATLFLSEVYGMSDRADIDSTVGDKLRLAVKLTCQCQNDAGGWRYQPVKSDADLSITICNIMGLRAARDAGIHVPDEVRRAGGVEDVDLDVVPLDRCHGERHRDLAVLLVGVVVRHGVPVLDRAHAGDRTGREEHRFHQRRLPGTPVPHQQDVADVLRVVGLQQGSFSAALFGARGR